MTTVRDVMSHRVEYLQTTTSAVDAARYLATRGLGAVALCQPNGCLAGVVTEHDLVVQVIAQGKDPAAFTVGDLPELAEAFAVGPDDSVEEVAAAMERRHAEHVPVVDHDRIVGLVERRDIARTLTFGRSWADV
jgi:CBS domain-containing protein